MLVELYCADKKFLNICTPQRQSSFLIHLRLLLWAPARRGFLERGLTPNNDFCGHLKAKETDRLAVADAFLKSRGTYVVFRISRMAASIPSLLRSQKRKDVRRDSDKAEITASPSSSSFPFESECEEGKRDRRKRGAALTMCSYCSSLLRHSIVVAMIHRIPRLL